MGETTRASETPDARPVDADEVAALRAIVEGTAHHTGEEFFRSLVRNLSAATGLASASLRSLPGATPGSGPSPIGQRGRSCLPLSGTLSGRRARMWCGGAFVTTPPG